MGLEDQIIEVLKKNPNGIKAKDIAKEIPGTTNHDINPVLYKYKESKFIHDENTKTWTLKANGSVSVNSAAKTKTAKPVTANSVMSNAVSCPDCGAPMLKRVAQKGPNKGNEFWGCSNFPKCKGTSPITNQNKTLNATSSKVTKSSSAQNIVKSCNDCLFYIKDECDGDGDPSKCKAYVYGL